MTSSPSLVVSPFPLSPKPIKPYRRPISPFLFSSISLVMSLGYIAPNLSNSFFNLFFVSLLHHQSIVISPLVVLHFEYILNHCSHNKKVTLKNLRAALNKSSLCYLHNRFFNNTVSISRVNLCLYYFLKRLLQTIYSQRYLVPAK